MTDTVLHIVGYVGTDVDHRKVSSGIDLATFRLATTPRRWDRNQGKYVDGITNWISVQCWRGLAVHVHDSVQRGDPVVVIGKLKTEEWTKDGVRNSRLILEATAVGHDLSRGITRFRKSPRQVEPPVDDSQAAVKALQDIESVEPVASGDSAGEEAVLPDAS